MSRRSIVMLTGQLNKDYVGGALTFVLGIAAVMEGQTYGVGTLSHMGPGYFPVAVGAMLSLTGVVIIAMAALRSPTRAVAVPRPEWRGWIFIVASIIAFIVLGTYGGLVPAAFAVVFIAALGDRHNRLIHALILSLAMLAICVAVFWWALAIQLPLFQWG